MNMIDAAIRYACRGWKVFPCQAGLKIPYPGTNGVKDATDDIDTIKSWWKIHPDANIALACGEPSGVWVVDVDVGHKEGVDGFKTLEERGITLPQTITQTTPSGGRHYLYSGGGNPPRNKNNFMHGVDIRGTGYYIVLAPSTVGGRSYSWDMPEDVVATMDPSPYPDEMRPGDAQQQTLMPWATQPLQPSSRTENQDNPFSASVTERASRYLETVDAAVQGAGGHDALMWAAQCLVVGFNLDDETAKRILWDEYNPRCVPPWNRASPSERKDFERKVSEARRHPVKPFGFLMDEGYADMGDEESRRLIGIGCDAVSRWSAQSSEEPPPDRDAFVPQDAPVADARQSIPDEILNPPGLVGEICRYMNDTAGCYQPLLALGASLTLCGALFGRKVKDESGGRTNVYAMGVGHSSAGKDHAAKCISKIIQSAKAELLLGGEVTSDTAIEICLKGSEAKLFVMDEVGHFLRTINRASGQSPHLKTIVPMFMKLFSSANSLYIGKQRVTGGPANQIDQPCVCIWGVTSPQILFDNMTREELEGGWTARNLVFITETRPRYRFVPETPVPASITNTVSAWFTRTIPPPEGAGNMAYVKAHQIVVPTSADAWEVFNAFGEKAHKKMLAADKSGDVCNYLWGKALENARRIALIIACGENYDGIEIGRAEAAYGCQLVEFLITKLSEAVHANVAESQWEHDKQRIYKIILSAQEEGVSKTELTRRTQWVRDRKQRNEFLSDLFEAGMIATVAKVPKGCRIVATTWIPNYVKEDDDE